MGGCAYCCCPIRLFLLSMADQWRIPLNSCSQQLPCVSVSVFFFSRCLQIGLRVCQWTEKTWTTQKLRTLNSFFGLWLTSSPFFSLDVDFCQMRGTSTAAHSGVNCVALISSFYLLAASELMIDSLIHRQGWSDEIRVSPSLDPVPVAEFSF